jgi:gamma-glutamylcyclotransferase
MFKRCPDATSVRVLELLGWKLVFRRTADIVPAVGHTVLGGLYRITGADDVALDRHEGVHRGRYQRKHFLIGDEWALSYFMNGSYAEEGPAPEYLALIEQGYRDWKLPFSGVASEASNVQA